MDWHKIYRRYQVGSQVIYPNDFCDPDIGNAKERRCLFFRELSCITFLIILSYSSYKCSAHSKIGLFTTGQSLGLQEFAILQLP